MGRKGREDAGMTPQLDQWYNSGRHLACLVGDNSKRRKIAHRQPAGCGRDVDLMGRRSRGAGRTPRIAGQPPLDTKWTNGSRPAKKTSPCLPGDGCKCNKTTQRQRQGYGNATDSMGRGEEVGRTPY
ncbi:hypothetical protein BaRGS_00015348 [Batillaria attramentaria]|uniref:Uncharacterized protein n=1 Tax=Batillaria attramentaria TaxID=370345 RepID=A0ABD0L1N8_9CAEN